MVLILTPSSSSHILCIIYSHYLISFLQHFQEKLISYLMAVKNTIACVRCKSSKRKCDGDHAKGTACSNCVKSSSECKYNIPVTPEHLKSLKQRIEFLEAQLEQSENRRDVENRQVGKSLVDYAALIPLKDDDKAHYVGFSGLNMARLIENHLYQDLDTREQNQTDQLVKEDTYPMVERILADEQLTSYYLDNYTSLIHSKYPFLQISHIRALHEKKNYIMYGEKIERFTLLMIYAIGAYLKHLPRDLTLSNHHYLYNYAIKDLDLVIDSDLSSIHSILLLVIYKLRKPSGVAIWYLIGSALRLCIDLGLHRRNILAFVAEPVDYLIRSRTFWCVYSLERIISSAFGRPFSISDRDIDSDLPIDLDELVTDIDLIKNEFYLTYPQHNHENFVTFAKPENKRTSMTIAILYFKLRKIDSIIHSSLYRVDKQFEEIPRELIFNLQAKMKDWISSLPSFLTTFEYDYCLYLFNKQIRSLLIPFAFDLEADDPLFIECINSSINICKINRRIHDSVSLKNRLSIISLQTIFLSGITLVYGLFSGKIRWDFEVSEALRSCSTTLVLLSARDPTSAQYGEAFEKLLAQVNSTRSHQMSPNSGSKVDLFGQERLMKTVNQMHYKENMQTFNKFTEGDNDLDSLLNFSNIHEMFDRLNGLANDNLGIEF